MEVGSSKDFFISYNNEDGSWAEWIAWQLEERGYSVILQAWDFRVGQNFVTEMQRALKEAEHTILILSSNYFSSRFAQAEWADTFVEDPTGQKRKLIPIRIQECVLPPLLRDIIYIDLVGLDENAARAKLFEGLSKQRGKPMHPPKYPGKASALLSTREPQPSFPGVPRISMIPHKQALLYRDSHILEDLHNLFQGSEMLEPRHVVAITGEPGIGKTQTATAYAYHYFNSGYYRMVLWTQGDTIEKLRSDFVAIAALLNLSTRDRKVEEIIVNDVKDWLTNHTNWLLIIDNVDSISDVKDFIPSKGNGDVLITTRIQNQNMQGIAEKFPLERMTPEEGAKFLLDQIDITPRLNDDSRAEEISSKVEGLPLALLLAGAYIKQTKSSLEDYLHRYEEKRSQLDSFISKNHYSEAITTTFTLSFQMLHQKSPIAIELLYLCAFLHPDTIPEDLIIIGNPDDIGAKLELAIRGQKSLDEAFPELFNYALIMRKNEEKTLSIHDSVQKILRDEMGAGEKKRWLRRAIKVINRAFPRVIEPSSWQECQRYLPHALLFAELTRLTGMEYPEAAQLLHRTGWYLLERAQYGPAKECLELARRFYEAQSGPEDLEMSNVLDNLGRHHVELGKYNEAESLYKLALIIREKILGKEDPAVAQILNHLGLLYYNQGEYTQAEPYYNNALSIQKKRFEDNKRNVAITLTNLAWLYYNLGRYGKAEEYLDEARLLQEHAQDTQKDLATTLNALALVYRSTNRYSKAKETFLHTLKIREEVLGPRHPDVATTLNDMAWLYRTLGEYDEAEKLYQRVWSIRLSTLGPRHLHTATTLNDIAVLYVDRGRYGKVELNKYQQINSLLGESDRNGLYQVEALYQKALMIRQETLGSEHPRVANTLYNMGWLYYHQGKYAQADSFHKRALDTRRRFQPDYRVHLAQSLNALAEVLQAQGKYREAKRYYQEALVIRNQELKREHRNTIASLGNLASLYADMGMYAEAEKYYEEALALLRGYSEKVRSRMALIYGNAALLNAELTRYSRAESLYQEALDLLKQVSGTEEHPDVTAILSTNLAALYILERKYDLAQSYMERMLDTLKDIFGIDHPYVAQYYYDQALLYHEQRKYNEAEENYTLSLTIRRAALGREHPSVAQSLSSLAHLYFHRENYLLAEIQYEQALNIYRRVFKSKYPPHLHVAQTFGYLAELYQEQNEDNKAKLYYEHALRIYDKLFTDEQPHLHHAQVLRQYATVLRRMHRFAEAQKQENDAKKIENKHKQRELRDEMEE